MRRGKMETSRKAPLVAVAEMNLRLDVSSAEVLPFLAASGSGIGHGAVFFHQWRLGIGRHMSPVSKGGVAVAAMYWLTSSCVAIAGIRGYRPGSFAPTGDISTDRLLAFRLLCRSTAAMMEDGGSKGSPACRV